jgi:hypothetical protein
VAVNLEKGDVMAMALRLFGLPLFGFPRAVRRQAESGGSVRKWLLVFLAALVFLLARPGFGQALKLEAIPNPLTPVNAASASSRDTWVAIAWYSEANDNPRV